MTIFSRIAASIARRWKKNFRKEKYQLSVWQKLQLKFKEDKGINHFHVMGKPISFAMNAYWFRHSYDEIFDQEVYRFKTEKTSPIILDCGANIGLSVIYFKTKYPGAKVIAFEPDEDTYGLLTKNIEAFGYKDVVLEKKAVWTDNSVLQFDARGGMAGTLILPGTAEIQKKVDVAGADLKQYLRTEIDFLKMDIEGPELLVLKDCEGVLSNVKNLFVEYHCFKGEEQKLDELLALFTRTGFRYYIRAAYEAMRYPYEEKTGEFSDLQLNIFCFRP